MIDILLVAEWMWCTILLATRTPVQIMVLAAAGVSTAYGALHVADWFTLTFIPPASPVLHWIEARIVVAHAPLWPPAAVAAVITGSHIQWVAYQTVRYLFFCCAIATVFSAFLAVMFFMDAIRDEPPGWNSRYLRYLLGLPVAAMVVCLTAVLLEGAGPLLSPVLAFQINASVLLDLINRCLAMLKVW